jgi:hypothetical protein
LEQTAISLALPAEKQNKKKRGPRPPVQQNEDLLQLQQQQEPQQEPQLQQQPQPLSALELEKALKQAGTASAIAAILEKQLRPLTPSELVLCCNQYARVCIPSTMTVKTWKKLQVGSGRVA